MKLSFLWLKDYVSVGLAPEKLAHRLTLAGMEVEKIEYINGDAVFELEITPNRPDCLSVLGLAREAAAATGKPLHYPKYRQYKSPARSCDIKILDQEGCRRYIGIVIKDVRVKPCAGRLAQRIMNVGLRPINNIVDITNFCLMETGQPLHAFDYDKLEDGKIVVRRARAGEKIVTIEGVQRTLDPSVLVIADARRPVAIAGIMGGQETEVTDTTKNILLESAYFDPLLIRRAARSLGLSSDSSYRFERGVDLAMVKVAGERALALIREAAGGVITQAADVFPSQRKVGKTRIEISIHQINGLLGAALSASRCKTILKSLGFKVKLENRQVLKAEVPSFRPDVKQPVDLIEEISRISGYDQLPTSLPTVRVSSIPVDPRRALRQAIRSVLLGHGFHEAITYALISQKDLEDTQLLDLPAVRVQNPLTKEQEFLRPHLLPNMLTALRTNIHRGQKDIRLFEAGKIYTDHGEKEALGIIMSGCSRSEDWRLREKQRTDLFNLMGTINNILARFKLEILYEDKDNGIFLAGQSAQVRLGQVTRNSNGVWQIMEGDTIGILGELNKNILKRWDIKIDHIFFAQIDLEKLYTQNVHPKQYTPVPQYPTVVRDLSIAVKDSITFRQVKEIAFEVGGPLLTGVFFVEEYRDEKKIPSGQRGLVFSLLFQSDSRTLTDTEVNDLHGRIGRALADRLAVVIR